MDRFSYVLKCILREVPGLATGAVEMTVGSEEGHEGAESVPGFDEVFVPVWLLHDLVADYLSAGTFRNILVGDRFLNDWAILMNWTTVESGDVATDEVDSRNAFLEENARNLPEVIPITSRITAPNSRMLLSTREE